MQNKTLLPFLVFILIVVFLAIGLNLKPGEVPSPFIGKPAPKFSLETLGDKNLRITRKEMLGKVWMLNVWASWCAACRDEHSLLNKISQDGVVEILGLNYKDTRFDANKWLDQFGNPYSVIAFDENGDVGIDYGVYGVPETFVIDKNGMVRLKHIGPLTRNDISQSIIPLVKSLEKEKI